MKKLLVISIGISFAVNSFAAGHIVTISTFNTCFGICSGTASAIVTGGVGPYSYDWAPGSPPGDGTPTISGLCPGSYSVLVTDNSDMSTATTSFVITQDPQITTATAGLNATCNGLCNGQGIVIPSGGTPSYTYLWSNGGTSGAVAGLCAGPYTYTVTDAHGCTATGGVNILQPGLLTVSLSSTPASCGTCMDGSATVLVTGGTAGYTYLWSPSGDFGAVAPGLLPGTYTCCVTDAQGCQTCQSIIVSFSTGIEEGSLLSEVSVSPNPFTDNTTFVIQSEKMNDVYSFELTDVLGKKVRSVNGINAKQFQVSREGLQNGIYFYKIYSAESIVGIGKLIVK